MNKNFFIEHTHIEKSHQSFIEDVLYDVLSFNCGLFVELSHVTDEMIFPKGCLNEIYRL